MIVLLWSASGRVTSILRSTTCLRPSVPRKQVAVEMCERWLAGILDNGEETFKMMTERCVSMLQVKLLMCRCESHPRYPSRAQKWFGDIARLATALTGREARNA